jgi:glucose 1-dehydrogenase
MRGIAARTGSGEAFLGDIAEPGAPGEGEVLCRTLELGVCGTDREILASQQPMLPDGAEFLILGHECLGRVESVGGGVTECRPGDLVVPVVRRARGGYTRRPDLLAVGQFTERGIYHEHGFSTPLWLDRPEYLVAVAADSRSVAVLAEPVAVVEKGVHEACRLQAARLGPSDPLCVAPRVLVTGLGPIAFAGIMSARRRGWKVTVYGRDSAESPRVELVHDFGGRYIREEDWVTEPGDLEEDGFDLLLECTGSDEVLARTSLSLASCGAAVWLGSSRQARPRQVNLAAMMRNGVIGNHLHLGSVNASLDNFQDALETLAWSQREHSSATRRTITSTVGPEDALVHFRRRTPQGIKTVVRFGEQ